MLTPGVSVHVTDAVTAQPIADAKVTAEVGGRPQAIANVGSGDYEGGRDTGTYVVRVHADGYRDEERSVAVGLNACGTLSTQTVDVALSR